VLLVLVLALVGASVVIIRLVMRTDELKDLILWYRKALAERGAGWQELREGTSSRIAWSRNCSLGARFERGKVWAVRGS